MKQAFQTLGELFLNAAESHAKPDAFLAKRAGRYQPLSSSEALRQAAAVALAFENFGLSRGDRVALLSENRVEWALTDYAALGLGAIDVPIYPTLPAADIEFILKDSGAKGIVVSTVEQLRKVQECRTPELRFVLMMDPAEPSGNGVHSGSGDARYTREFAGEDTGATAMSAAHSWQKIVERQLIETPEPEKTFRSKALEAKPGDTATLIYTSGTTGAPKGVVLTHSNIVSNVKACMPLFHFGVRDRAISFLPLSHILERMIEYFLFWSGSTIAYAESLEALPQNILEVRPTIMAVVPRVLEKVHGKILETVGKSPASRQKLFHWAARVGWQHASQLLERQSPSLPLRMKHAVADALVGSKIRTRLGGQARYLISGAAPLSRELAEFFYAMGLPVYEGYGLTETSPVVSVNCPGAVKLGTVGRVIPGVEVRLGEEAQHNAGREILVRGPNVSPGYYNQEEENRQSFSEGWFHTGDLGTLDSEGFLTLTGRKKNLMKTSGGKYVSPEKLEGLFQGHPCIAQMIVLGDSRHFVAALIVPDFEQLEAWARERQVAFNSREELVRHPEIQVFMQCQVDEVCKELAPFERIRQIGLLPREFTVDSGELSPTQKVRRFIVEERYRELIEEIYRRPAPAEPSRRFE